MDLAALMPATKRRVEASTDADVNARNRQRLRENVARARLRGRAGIDARIAELQREWDTERALEANAAVVSLIGLGLGAFVDRRWFALPAVVATFLLQHAVQGWCPPLPVMRRLGVRTASEINDELTALRLLRGDFGKAPDADQAVDRALGTGAGRAGNGAAR
jgi:hypothetical protein